MKAVRKGLQWEELWNSKFLVWHKTVKEYWKRRVVTMVNLACMVIAESEGN